MKSDLEKGSQQSKLRDNGSQLKDKRANLFLVVAIKVFEPTPVHSWLLTLSLSQFLGAGTCQGQTGCVGLLEAPGSSLCSPCAGYSIKAYLRPSKIETVPLQDCVGYSATLELKSLKLLLMYLEFVKCPGHSENFWPVFMSLLRERLFGKILNYPKSCPLTVYWHMLGGGLPMPWRPSSASPLCQRRVLICWIMSLLLLSMALTESFHVLYHLILKTKLGTGTINIPTNRFTAKVQRCKVSCSRSHNC